MHESHYGGPGGYLLMTLSLVFAWLGKVTMEQIAFTISACSGVLGIIRFGLGILAEWKRYKETDSDKTEKDN